MMSEEKIERQETTLGPLPKSWGVVKFSDTCEAPQYGYTETASQLPIGPKFLRITDIQDFTVNWDTTPYCLCEAQTAEKYLLCSGDLVFARIGATAGKSYLVSNPPKAVFASYLIRLRPTKVYPAFLYYFCQSELYWQQVNAIKGENLKGGFSGSVLTNFLHCLPRNIQEQKAIATVLSKIQSAIEIQNKTIATLNKIFKSTLHKLLIKNNSNKRAIGIITQKTKLIDPSKTPTVNFQYVDVSAVDRDSWAITTTTSHSGSTAPSRARKHIQSGDVIFATVRPTLKRVAIVPDELDGQIASTAFCIIRPITNEADNKFLFYSLLTEEFENKMAAIEHGANYPAVTDKEVLSQEIWLPSLPEQERISSYLSKIHTKIHLHNKKVEVLKKVFSSMLHLLITGELRIPDTLECFNKEVFDV